MNLNAPIADHSIGEDDTFDFGGERTIALSAFAPTPRRSRSRNSRTAGIMGVILVHGIVALLYAFGGPSFTRTTQQSLSVIDIAEDLPEAIEPPPPPKFLPPEVYISVPIDPIVTLAEPPPTPNAITLPPPPLEPRSVTVPFVQPVLVPFDGDARATYVAALLKHLNRFKRYPESAKLRHEQGVVSLRFTIDAAGHVLAASVTKPSGSDALDKEVLAAVKRADPLPRIPNFFGRDKLDLVVPVEFVLR